MKPESLEKLSQVVAVLMVLPRSPDSAADAAKAFRIAIQDLDPTEREVSQAGERLLKGCDWFPTPAQLRRAILESRPPASLIVDPVYTVDEGGEVRMGSRRLVERSGRKWFATRDEAERALPFKKEI